MSLVAFCMMSGGAIGTALGGRMIEAGGFTGFYGLWAVLLSALAGIAFFAISGAEAVEAPAPGALVQGDG